MAHGYSTDLRERAVGYVQRGGSRSSACEIFQIGAATLQRWISQLKHRGNLRAKPNGSRPWKLDHDAIVQYIKDNNDSTLEEVAAYFKTGVSAVDYVLRKRGVTRKKNHAIRRTRRRGKAKIPR